MKLSRVVLVVAAAFAVVQPLVAQGADKMRVHIIDVGQGDAALVEFPCGAILIDTGGEQWLTEDGQAVLYDSNVSLYAYLNWFFNHRPDLDRRLDVLFLTHPHKDHTRGVPMVLQEFQPKNVVHNGQEEGSGVQEQNLAREYANRLDDVGGWYVLEDLVKADDGGLVNRVIDPLDCSGQGTDPQIRVLWGQVRNREGWSYEALEDENNHSLVIRVDYGDASILFMGDLEEKDQDVKDAAIERLLRKYPKDEAKDWLQADVLHIGHHGSHNGTTEDLVKRVRPKIAILSSGPACPRGDYSAWGHAHPRKKVLDEVLPHLTGTREPVEIRYFDAWKTQPKTLTTTKALYGTGWDGTIVLEAAPDGVWSEASLSGPDLCVRGGKPAGQFCRAALRKV